MLSSLTIVATLFAAPPAVTGPDVPTEFRQVAPDRSDRPWVASAAPSEKTRAVVLIHGLFVHVVRPARAERPWVRDWQGPQSELVKLLAKDFDVFAFAYAQTRPVDDVPQSPGLRDAVAGLRKAGYTDIVFVGHSAGGVVARQFVERYPAAGVTKVVAVATPFAGSEFAALKIGYPKVQAPFIQSLAPAARTDAVKSNPPAIGKDVEFACVVCKLKRVETDGVVLTKSQWPDELQTLGVPAALAPVSHFDAMHNTASVKTIVELAREKLTRWPLEDVEKARRVLFGEMPKPD